MTTVILGGGRVARGLLHKLALRNEVVYVLVRSWRDEGANAGLAVVSPGVDALQLQRVARRPILRHAAAKSQLRKARLREARIRVCDVAP